MSKIKTTTEFEAIFDIDANLNRLVKNIELLNYINPLNIAAEKKKFFSAKYNYEPEFKYPKIKFDGYKLHRLLFSQRLERIEDDAIRQLYEDVIYEYSGLIECIETIGKGKKFYFNSLKSFGTPTERDIENAKFILRFDNVDNADLDPIHDAEYAKQYFNKFSERYDFKYTIKISNNLSAAAMVLNNTQTLVLRKNHKFSNNQLRVLANHEIGVHLVTTFNGLSQPLKVFSNGFPNNVETQEGLAVYSEYMSGSLTMYRLRELAFRVIAADSLSKGYSFSDTFDLLYGQYKLERNEAFSITQRVHRGGGFTKDFLYLSGLRNVFQFANDNQDLVKLLMGKVCMSYTNTIDKLIDIGLAIPPIHFTDAYLENKNNNPKLDFILEGLK